MYPRSLKVMDSASSFNLTLALSRLACSARAFDAGFVLLR